MFLEVNSLFILTLILMLNMLSHLSILLNPWITNISNLISDSHDEDGQGQYETD